MGVFENYGKSTVHLSTLELLYHNVHKLYALVKSVITDASDGKIAANLDQRLSILRI